MSQYRAAYSTHFGGEIVSIIPFANTLLSTGVAFFTILSCLNIEKPAA